MKRIILSVVMLLGARSAILSQNVGIGTTGTPVARLEVRGEGNNNLANSLVLRNLAGDTLFRVRNDGRVGIAYNGTSYGRAVNIGGNGVNFYRDDTHFGGAIFPTDTSIVIWSDVSDDKYAILQPSWGKVGVGTFSPQAKLDVKGPVILGDNGTVIQNVIKITVSKNLPGIPANSAFLQNFTVTGTAIGSSVSISPGIALADGLLISYARVSAANTVEVKFMNTTFVTLDQGLTAFFITVIE